MAQKDDPPKSEAASPRGYAHRLLESARKLRAHIPYQSAAEMNETSEPFDTMLAETLSHLARGPAATPAKTRRPTAELVRLRAEVIRRHGIVLDIVDGFLVILDSDSRKNNLGNIISNFVDIKHKIYTQLLVAIHEINEQFQLGLASERVDSICEALLERLLSPDKSNTEAEAQHATSVETLLLPSEIPESERYAAKGKDYGRSIVRFLEEGWPAPFIKAGILTKPALRNLDPSAYTAVANYTRDGRELPPHLQLPTSRRSYRLDTELLHVDREALREAERLARAVRRRDSGRE